MNRKIVFSSIMAISLSAAGFAFGQNSGDHSDHMQRRDEGRQSDRKGFEYRAHNNAARGEERGAGPNRDFHRGDHLPPEYRNRQYVVDDWRGHHLNAPPRGYHWVQVGGDYVLAAIGTGIILQLLLDNN
ncbi:RcnB family protein [Glaciimonas sp. GG7]